MQWSNFEICRLSFAAGSRIRMEPQLFGSGINPYVQPINMMKKNIVLTLIFYFTFKINCKSWQIKEKLLLNLLVLIFFKSF
jgi:hypothetical protein